MALCDSWRATPPTTTILRCILRDGYKAEVPYPKYERGSKNRTNVLISAVQLSHCLPHGEDARSSIVWAGFVRASSLASVVYFSGLLKRAHMQTPVP